MRPNRSLTGPLAAMLALAILAGPAAAQGPETDGGKQDLRSPDARDAAEGRSTADVGTPVVEITRADGFDWSDAAIGAGGATGLLAISLAGAMTLRRRQTPPRSSTAVS